MIGAQSRMKSSSTANHSFRIRPIIPEYQIILPPFPHHAWPLRRELNECRKESNIARNACVGINHDVLNQILRHRFRRGPNPTLVPRLYSSDIFSLETFRSFSESIRTRENVVQPSSYIRSLKQVLKARRGNHSIQVLNAIRDTVHVLTLFEIVDILKTHVFETDKHFGRIDFVNNILAVASDL